MEVHGARASYVCVVDPLQKKLDPCSPQLIEDIALPKGCELGQRWLTFPNSTSECGWQSHNAVINHKIAGRDSLSDVELELLVPSSRLSYV